MQEIFRAVVAVRAVITRVAPPAECERFRRQLSRVCVRSGPRLLQWRLVLLSLPNKNILRRDRVEVFVPAGEAVNETLVKNIVGESCADVCGKSFAAKRRWTDGDLSTSSICSRVVAWRRFNVFARLSRGQGTKCLQGS